MSVTWTEIATGQLQAVHDYLALSSPGYALALADRIVARTEALDTQPFFGAEVQEYGDPEIRELLRTSLQDHLPAHGSGRSGGRRHPASRRRPVTPPG